MMTVLAKKRGRREDTEEKKENIESKSEVVTREMAIVKPETLKKKGCGQGLLPHDDISSFSIALEPCLSRYNLQTMYLGRHVRLCNFCVLFSTSSAEETLLRS